MIQNDFSSIIEFVLVYFDLMQPLGVSVLRSARLLRIFKVTKLVIPKHF